MKMLHRAIGLSLLMTIAAHAGDQDTNAEATKVHQQTAYQVDPIKLRIVGHEHFKIHRIMLEGELGPQIMKPYEKGDPVSEDETHGAKPNGTMTFYGKCLDDDGLTHWGDCRKYDGSFTIDVVVAGRYEYDTSGLGRNGYVIGMIKDGARQSIDADHKTVFLNGPPTKVPAAAGCSCPYRLVINPKHPAQLVQGITMEPVYEIDPTRKKE